jgi:hypothetical protein
MSQESMFKSLNINVPESVNLYSIEQQKEIYEYLNEMNELEKKTYEIAVSHLGTSFNIYRSNGFVSWKKNKK